MESHGFRVSHTHIAIFFLPHCLLTYMSSHIRHLRDVVTSELQQGTPRSVPEIVAEEWAKYMSSDYTA